MRTVTTIFIIFLAQCTYLYAKPKPGIDNQNSCIHGVKSVTVFLYNSRNKNIAINESCDNIDSSQPVIFLVHGFISSAYASKFQELASNLAQKGYTVLILDWSQAACTEDISIVNYLGYPWAVKNTQEIGHLMANYTNVLIKQCSIPIKNIIFIGHSLGAHVSGFAAKEVAENNNEKIPLIIAADPANPMFNSKECKARLCKSDAEHVKVFHTSLTFGMWHSIGDCDFFFNDGRMQPGCDILKISSCSHSRSVEYLIDITKNIHCGFPAVPKTSSPFYPSDTKDCIIVNYSIIFKRNNPMKGNYFVFVKAKSPHCTLETFKCNNNSKSLNLKH